MNISQTSNDGRQNVLRLQTIRACFLVTCPRLDENDGTCEGIVNTCVHRKNL